MSTRIRLQEYGVGLFKSAFTKSALKKALKKNYITVNEHIATSATYIQGGECIKLEIPKDSVVTKSLIFRLTILFEDDYLAIIHKPAGILVSGNSFKTIANALGQNLKRSTRIDATKPQPVHRLDYATTGILMVGKTSSSIRDLNQLFRAKAIKKTYFAVTIGKMETEGDLNADIDTKTSQTTYKVLATVTSKRFGCLNLVQLQPKTGRRHQLRKHLSGIGNPILGDKTYGKKDLILNGQGLYLHAHALHFKHPFTNNVLTIKDPLPKRFLKLFAAEILKIENNS
ncbi:RluA family pseudouridine synthase [Winogradskyella sp.]|nr:RluA family pseudouridine synthase [Winogradskyella sp.]MDC0006404.1 RluA family pseudouridine synthase [Winogradskyella sp.]MDC0009555.1 RluA family pseudouridine synthase [Winogradskyella sp.]